MKYTGTIYRPPLEANTLLLQVTVGCTHNKCSFCTMYKDVQFSIEHIDQIEKDLREARKTYTCLTRIFLLNADAFALSARRLKEIASKIIEYFPEMEVITMYASIRNMKDKTDTELKELRDLKINDLWVGVESGNDTILNRLNKGYTASDAKKQLSRLNEVGIRHNCILMLGTGGNGAGDQHITDTAALINATNPQIVGVTSLGFFEGSGLAKEVAAGNFIPATELEILEEERTLIKLIEVENLQFIGDHPINAVSISGLLPGDREDMIATLNYVIETSDDQFLNGVTGRYAL